MKVLSIIPARCGSKGFPNKNIAQIEGHTLIEWAINIAEKSNFINDIYISTDCKKYENIALKAGAKSLGLRSKELAGDFVKTADVVLDIIAKLPKYDYIVLLQPTSPIRRGTDIDRMIELLEENREFDSIISVEKIEEPHPNKLKKIENNQLLPFLVNSTSEIPRQLLGDVYKLNGAIYVVKYNYFKDNKSFFGKTLPYIQDFSVNIDSEMDFILLQTLLRYKNTTLKELCNV